LSLCLFTPLVLSHTKVLLAPDNPVNLLFKVQRVLLPGYWQLSPFFFFPVPFIFSITFFFTSKIFLVLPPQPFSASFCCTRCALYQTLLVEGFHEIEPLSNSLQTLLLSPFKQQYPPGLRRLSSTPPDKIPFSRALQLMRWVGSGGFFSTWRSNLFSVLFFCIYSTSIFRIGLFLWIQ